MNRIEKSQLDQFILQLVFLRSLVNDFFKINNMSSIVPYGFLFYSSLFLKKKTKTLTYNRVCSGEMKMITFLEINPLTILTIRPLILTLIVMIMLLSCLSFYHYSYVVNDTRLILRLSRIILLILFSKFLNIN